MPIKLSDLWRIENPGAYKVHFARWNQLNQPLDVWARDPREWQGWQEYRPQRDDFNRPRIFALMQFYHETDAWLFGGVFDVLARHADRYEVALAEEGRELIGRLKISSAFRGRGTRLNFEKHYPEFEVLEILREPYAGRGFPGFDNIDLSFEELEAIVRNERRDWKGALASVKGVYLITNLKTRRRYVGSAYGEDGIWSRWRRYIETGHGGNVELRQYVSDPNLAYCRANFRFALLEQLLVRTPDEVVLAREAFWKRVLLTRDADGLNRN